MVQDGRGNETITEGASILKQTRVLHPAARMLAEPWLKRTREVAPHHWSLLLAHALSPIAVTTFFRMDLLFLSHPRGFGKGY